MKKNISFRLMAVSLVFFYAVSLPCPVFAEPVSAPPKVDQDPVMRVNIIDDTSGIKMVLKGRYKITDVISGISLSEGPYLTAKVEPGVDGIKLNAKDLASTGIRVKVFKDANIYIENKRFRGDVDILKKPNGNLMVINYIPLEEYLYGVLYHEVSHRWPMEALKVQAIAARTFALYQARQNKTKPYDLRSDIYSQVYGGRTSEKWSTTRAVDLTRGQVLTYKADIFPAYYHATCAGHTEDASNLWNIDIPPLKGVVCNFCMNSPHYKWSKELPLWEAEKILKDKGYAIDKIASIEVLSTNASGRVDKLEIKSESNNSVILTGKDFRQMIGPNEIRSTKFSASIKRGKLVMAGTGWGHGVGMCQWGVYGQARRGKRADEILKYYYPGTEISSINKLKTVP